MGLKLYHKNTDDEFIEISANENDDLDPLTSTHDGKTGSVVVKQLYINNDDASKWFSNIIINPIDTIDANPYGDVGYDETGWGVKLSESINEPSESEWEDIHWGEQIDILNVGSESAPDITTYLPFWYLETCPPNEDAKIKTDIVINVSYTENAVI